MVRRGHENEVHVRPGQDLPEIVVIPQGAPAALLGVMLGNSFPGLDPPASIRVAEVRGHHILAPKEGIKVAVALAAAAYDPQAKPL
jgi:hypothetical protein